MSNCAFNFIHSLFCTRDLQTSAPNRSEVEPLPEGQIVLVPLSLGLQGKGAAGLAYSQAPSPLVLRG